MDQTPVSCVVFGYVCAYIQKHVKSVCANSDNDFLIKLLKARATSAFIYFIVFFLFIAPLYKVK